MITVQIAGAGAGKTFGLASKIADRIAVAPSTKSIYALTYTNSAKNKIKIELVKNSDCLHVNVDTVHSFLLKEIIFPYASYVLGEKYSSVSLETLPSNNQMYKNARLKDLKSKGIIHVDNVYMVAKQILDKNNHKNNNLYKKSKVDYICNIISQMTCSIFIDEVQDLDQDCLRVFHILGGYGVYIYMVGDPKQAIKYPDSFNDYISEHAKGNGDVIFEPVNNITRRVPSSLLEISNVFCYTGQEQTNYDGRIGCVKYLYNDTPNYDIMLQQALLNGKLVIINQKNDYYHTKNGKEHHFPKKLARILENSPSVDGRDLGLYINSLYLDLMEQLNYFPENPSKSAANYVIRKHDLSGLLRKNNAFGIFYEFASQCSQEKSTNATVVKSIESVKGLDSDVVFFILTESFINYLNHTNIPVESPFNKEWKKLYVALTRSSDKFVFVLDKRMVGEEGLKKAVSYLQFKEIALIDDAAECLDWFKK